MSKETVKRLRRRRVPRSYVFAEIMRGLFYLSGAAMIATVLFLVMTIWQPIWTEGFKNFHSISSAIVQLNRTTKPMSTMAPMIVKELDSIRIDISAMQSSIEENFAYMQPMTEAVERIDLSAASMSRNMQYIPPTMQNMNMEMYQMRDQFSPTGMMPWNW